MWLCQQYTHDENQKANDIATLNFVAFRAICLYILSNIKGTEKQLHYKD